MVQNELKNTGTELAESLIFLLSLFPFIISFIAAYILEFKLLKRIDFLWDKKKKIEKARERGQVVIGYIKSREQEYLDEDDYCMAKYVYEINGVKRSMVVNLGKQTGRGVERYPKTINIYYLGRKTYTEYDSASLMVGVSSLLMFFAAGMVAIGVQGCINVVPLLSISSEISEFMYIFKNGGLGIAVFLVIVTVIYKIYDATKK